MGDLGREGGDVAGDAEEFFGIGDSTTGDVFGSGEKKVMDEWIGIPNIREMSEKRVRRELTGHLGWP